MKMSLMNNQITMKLFKKHFFLLQGNSKGKSHAMQILLFISIVFCAKVRAQVPVNISDFNKSGETSIAVKDEVVSIVWPTGGADTGKIVLGLKKEMPLIKSLQIGTEGAFQEIASELDPVFLLTVGKRDLEKRDGWVIFFDNPSHLPFETYTSNLDKQSVKVESEGSRTHITVEGVTAGPFEGSIMMTLYNGSPLMEVEAIIAMEKDSLAIIYDAGLVSQQPWEEIWYSNPEGYLEDIVEEERKGQKVAVKYRTIIGQSDKGSLAVFPSPHQYFYPLDEAYNLSHTWYGNNYRDLVPGYGIGIRHDPLGDRRWVPWFNAPPHTEQHLNFFVLLGTQKDGKIIEKVKNFTHDDVYKPLPGYYTMASHFHIEHTEAVLTHKPLPEIPTFVTAFKDMGVNIVHLAEFHGPGSPRGPEIKRFNELDVLFKESARLSDGNFLLLPGEEANNFFGGHWLNLFPHPVNYVMSREEGQPYKEIHPEYGKIYRIGNKEEMLQLLEDENGLAWTAHPRIKGSTGYPDAYKDEKFYKSEHFLGAAWKNMPADLSHSKLGIRVLDLMDDMANWGQKKNVIGESDLFQVRPGYELYAHMNINYLQMDELPKFEEGWQPVLDAMKNGNFFVTTGEVLLPKFTVNGKSTGETVHLDAKGQAEVKVEISWTFPLKFAEIISGDGEKVYRKKIELSDTEAFGKKEFNFDVNLQDRKWVRFEVWDVASNGAFTQFVWLE